MKSKPKQEQAGPAEKAPITTLRHLAEAIVADILHVNDGEKVVECHRVALKAGTWPDDERDMGGLCEEALVELIYERLCSAASALSCSKP